jgi:hypothetical protein
MLQHALVETRSWGTKQQCQNLVPTRASSTELVPKALVGTKFWHCSVVLQDHHSISDEPFLVSMFTSYAFWRKVFRHLQNLFGVHGPEWVSIPWVSWVH